MSRASPLAPPFLPLPSPPPQRHTAGATPTSKNFPLRPCDLHHIVSPVAILRVSLCSAHVGYHAHRAHRGDSVRVTDLLSVGAIRVSTFAATKPDALIAVSETLAARLPGWNPRLIYEGIIDRERSEVTGLGCGVAVPHCRLSGLATPQLVLVLFPQGVVYGAVDGAPVYAAFALASSAGDRLSHLHVMAAVARHFCRASSLTDRTAQARELASLDDPARVLATLHRDAPPISGETTPVPQSDDADPPPDAPRAKPSNDLPRAPSNPPSPGWKSSPVLA